MQFHPTLSDSTPIQGIKHNNVIEETDEHLECCTLEEPNQEQEIEKYKPFLLSINICDENIISLSCMVHPGLDYDIMSSRACWEDGLIPTPYPIEYFEFIDEKLKIVGTMRDVHMQLMGSCIQHFLELLVVESPKSFSILFGKEWVHISGEYDYPVNAKDEEENSEEELANRSYSSFEEDQSLIKSMHEDVLQNDFTFEFFFDQEDEVGVEKKEIDDKDDHKFDPHLEFGDVEKDNFTHLKLKLDEFVSSEQEDKAEEWEDTIDEFLLFQDNDEFNSFLKVGDFEEKNSFMHLKPEIDDSFGVECEGDFEECAVLIDDFLFLQNNEGSIKIDQYFERSI